MESKGIREADTLRAIEAVRSGLTALAYLQSTVDDVTWDITSPPSHVITHTVLHLSKALGKISGFCERFQHTEHHGEPLSAAELRSLAEELDLAGQLAELVTVAARLTAVLGMDLSDVYLGLLRRNTARFASDSDIARTLKAT